MVFVLASPAFPPGGEIPAQYTCAGQDIAPPLRWSGAPAGTRSFVLAVVDSDAPGGAFGHWGTYDLPVRETALPAGRGGAAAPSVVNDFGRLGYGGPCPPPGDSPHHYHFELLALDVPRLAVPARAHVGELLNAAASHVLARAELVGRFGRGSKGE
jgi:Raf kinase inhibitor-like YbhB/YbcL family protein